MSKIGMVVTLIFLILDLIFLYSNKLSFQDLDGWLTDLERNDIAANSKIQYNYRFKPGNHKIWAGLETNAITTMGIAPNGATGFTAGKVNKITLYGISPPDTPTISGPETVNVNHQVEYDFNTIDYNGDPVKYIIDWGDGESTTTDFYQSEEGVSVSHSYNRPGSYTITVKAEDCDRMQSETGIYDIMVDGDFEGPDVRITCPEDAFYLRGNNRGRLPFPFIFDDITLRAEVDDSDNVDYVQFFIEGKLKKTDAIYPYTYDWTEIGLGYKDIEVVAFNGKNGYDSKRVFYVNVM